MSNKVIDADFVETTEVNYSLATLNNSITITSHVDKIVDRVNKTIADLELDKLEATTDNKVKIKNLRAELNKERSSAEADLRTIKKIILKDYNELENQVKTRILPLFKDTDVILKEKYDAISEQQLQVKTDYAKKYHAAKLKSMPLRIGGSFTDVPWEYHFNSSEKSIRETCDAHFTNVSQALTVIDNHEYKQVLEDLFIEYNYDLGKALFELEKRNQLAEALLRSKQQRQEEMNKVLEEANLVFEPATEPVVEPVAVMPTFEPIEEYTFKVELTDSQLLSLIQFFEENKITFQVIE